jgi:oxygen-dependent protoporphyrinogen oxidase
VGGAIRSIQKEKWLIEEGPNTIQFNTQSLWSLLDELNITDQLLETDKASQKRFVARNREPVSIPSSVGSFLTTPLLSTKAKLRLLKEPFVARSVQHDESVASFIERRLGKEPLDYGVNPFVSGIYAGDPKKLSVKHTFSKLWEMEQQYGSLFKGMLKRDRNSGSAKQALISFTDGNQTLPKAMAESLDIEVQTSTKVTSAQKNDTVWNVTTQQDGKKFQNNHHCLVSTLPAYAGPSIFDSYLFEELARLPYAPLSVLALGFKREQIDHPLDGFGMLIPETEGYQTLGVLFSSTLFPGRAPKEHALLTCFIGGDRNPEIAYKPQRKLQQIVLGELDELLGIIGDPVITHHRLWQQAIPQYKVGYDHYISLIKEIEESHHGLYLDGNYRNGVSVPDCIRSGFETAQKVQTFLTSTE